MFSRKELILVPANVSILELYDQFISQLRYMHFFKILFGLYFGAYFIIMAIHAF